MAKAPKITVPTPKLKKAKMPKKGLYRKAGRPSYLDKALKEPYKTYTLRRKK